MGGYEFVEEGGKTRIKYGLVGVTTQDSGPDVRELPSQAYERTMFHESFATTLLTCLRVRLLSLPFFCCSSLPLVLSGTLPFFLLVLPFPCTGSWTSVVHPCDGRGVEYPRCTLCGYETQESQGSYGMSPSPLRV